MGTCRYCFQPPVRAHARAPRPYMNAFQNEDGILLSFTHIFIYCIPTYNAFVIIICCNRSAEIKDLFGSLQYYNAYDIIIIYYCIIPIIQQYYYYCTYSNNKYDTRELLHYIHRHSAFVCKCLQCFIYCLRIRC
jgi:hypothetical protein